MDWGAILGLIVAIAIPVAGGFAGAKFGAGGDSPWYRQLNKPPWTPPSWVFPVMWTTLYILMGIASWLVWKDGGFKRHALPLAIYIVQLILNFAWTPIFFGYHRFDFAFAEIVLLWLAILATIILFWPVSHAAAYLLIPYILWVTLAASINLYVLIYNPSDGLTQPLQQSY
ncbi:hypothetical protein SELMODRAFT_180321 [Selaginella moellendorffii]|uniref:Tryptophan-rich sensory protein n=1 Tax=Selaginella moellendorffii TaxID=88036 RepID=D8SJT4_SELML|nr:uncharacterized protein LOC9655073 [Selaginella moellendorffii]EFJ15508.1 hypothetical protein SELMODRAFT_180321 [Selaginella moellendorffii]|eukprot:XP_002983607.1 uncharacterized protein LOC9655073 [Selaginella moellendorffii]